MSDAIQSLERELRHERDEERRNVLQMREWIAKHEAASRGFWRALFNRAEIRHANRQMQHYADLANGHLAKANALERRIADLRAEQL